MKTIITILGTVILVLFTCTAVAEPEIIREQVTWQQVAELDGEALYSNLCAACHGAGGKGNGPAARASQQGVPDLTRIAADNDGEFPHRHVQVAIGGKNREVSYDTIDCPDWENQFMYVEPGMNALRRRALARDRLHVLTNYIETIQADETALIAQESEGLESEEERLASQ